jgi:hypothetical protein
MGNPPPTAYDPAKVQSPISMTDSRFLACSLFALSLFAVPGIDVPNVGIDGISLASGSELRAGACNQVRVFVRAAPTYQGDARVQVVLREAAGDLVYSGMHTIAVSGGAEQTLVFDDIPVRAMGRHVLLASAVAGDAAESQIGLNVEGHCSPLHEAKFEAEVPPRLARVDFR